MSPPVEAFEYDHLTEVYRKEQRTKNITEVRKDLYVVIRQRLSELRRDTEREFALDQFSTRAKLAANQLTKFQEKADQVFEFRMEKLLAMALRAARGNRVDTNRLTSEEADIFERVSSLLRERHAALLETAGEASHHEPSTVKPPYVVEAPSITENVLYAAPSIVAEDVPEYAPEYAEDLEEAAMDDGDVEDVHDVPDEPLPAPSASPPEAPAAAAPIAEMMPDMAVLRVMEDLPPFAGPGRDYRLKKEDVVCLPLAVAKALVAGRKASIVQVPGL